MCSTIFPQLNKDFSRTVWARLNQPRRHHQRAGRLPSHHGLYFQTPYMLCFISGRASLQVHQDSPLACSVLQPTRYLRASVLIEKTDLRASSPADLVHRSSKSHSPRGTLEPGAELLVLRPKKAKLQHILCKATSLEGTFLDWAPGIVAAHNYTGCSAAPTRTSCASSVVAEV